jgi:anti-sigma factor RsiW
MTQDDFERLSAYADGELDNPRRLAVEADLERDPALRAMLTYIRATQSSLHQAYMHTYHSDVPDRLMAVLAQPPEKPAGAGNWFRHWRLPAFAALPATAAAGILAGWFAASALVAAPAASLMLASADGLVAGPELAHVLDTSVSGSQANVLGAATLIQLSFTAADGEACRQFQAGQTAGLACKQADGTWQIDASAATLAAVHEGYIPAAGDAPASIQAAIAGKGAIELLDAEGERAGIAAGWRP